MSVQLVILGLLSEQPRHGYELRQEVERRLYATYINLSGGSLYYNLGQLERSGYVEKAWAEQKGRYPKRQVYQITPAGKEYLGTELRRLLVDTESREKVFDPLNTAFAFGHFVDDDEIRDALSRQLQWAKERVAWIRGQREFWQTQEISFTQAKIIEHGLAHYEAEIDWLENFLQDLMRPNRQISRIEARAPSNTSLKDIREAHPILSKQEEPSVEGLSVLDMIQQGALVTYPLNRDVDSSDHHYCRATVGIARAHCWHAPGGSGLVGKLQKGDFKTALTTAQQDKSSPAGRMFRDVISQQDGESLEYLSEVIEDRRFEEVDASERGNLDVRHRRGERPVYRSLGNGHWYYQVVPQYVGAWQWRVHRGCWWYLGSAYRHRPRIGRRDRRGHFLQLLSHQARTH